MDFLGHHHDFQRHGDKSCPLGSQGTYDIEGQRGLPKYFWFLESSLPEVRGAADFEKEELSACPPFAEYGTGVSCRGVGRFDKQKFSPVEYFEETGKSAISGYAAEFFILLGGSFHRLPLFGPEISLRRIDTAFRFEKKDEIEHLP